VPVFSSIILITFGVHSSGPDEWTPNVIKMMEENTGTTLRAPGFPDQMMDAESVKNFINEG